MKTNDRLEASQVLPRKRDVVILSSVKLTAPTHAGEANLPADVIEFIQHRAGCPGLPKRPSDPDNAQQIEAAKLSMRCGDLENDEQVLRKSHADKPGVITSLNAKWVTVVQRFGVRTSIGA